MSSYKISSKALEDLDGIWLYTKEIWSLKQADRYLSLILDEINYVAQNFESGKSVDYLKPGYKVTKVKSHLIFYKKLDDKTIGVIRVLHERMDLENKIND